MWWRTWPLASQAGPKIYSCNRWIHAQQPPLFKVTLVGGQISHRGAAIQPGPELWLGKCAEWQGGKGITYRGAGIPRKWDALRDTDGPGYWEPGYTYDTGPWLSGNGLHLSQDKRDTHIWFNNWRLRCCQAVGGAQERQEYYYYFLAMSCGMWDLSFLTRDGNFTPCLESTESEPLGH